MENLQEENFTSSLGYPRLGLPLAGTLLYLSAYMPIILAAIFGNLLVIVAYFNERKLQKPGNIFIVSMAGTDLLTGMTFPMFAANRLLLSDLTCRSSSRVILFVPFLMCAVSSLTHLILIAVDRNIALTMPLQYPTLVTKHRCKVTVCTSWLCFVAGMAIWMAIYMYGHGSNHWICEGNFFTIDNIKVCAITMACLILVTMAAMFLCYYRMIRISLRYIHEREMRSIQTGQGKQENEFYSQIQVTVTMVIILGAFVICWAPSLFKFFYQAYGRYSADTLLMVQISTEILAYGNSTLNPIIYGYRNKTFRCAYKKILKKYFGSIFVLQGKEDDLNDSTYTLSSEVM